MDNLFQLSKKANESVVSDIEFSHARFMDVPGSEQQKTIFDAYEYQSGRTKDLALPNELALRNELVIRAEAIRLAEQRLLLEIIYLQALSAYYERLYACPRFDTYGQPFSQGSANRFIPSYSYGYPSSYARRHTSHQLHHTNHRAAIDSSDGTRIISPPFSPHSFSRHLVSIAEHSLGSPVWAFSKFASFCQRGYLGCAASVSELLQESGLRVKGSASVAGLVNELSSIGWHRIKIHDKHQFHAGDIVYGLRGSHAHIGIITAAENNKILVCDNSSSSGTLKERTIESGGSFTPNGRFAGSLYVMRQN